MGVTREDDGTVRLRGQVRFVEFAALLVGGAGLIGLGLTRPEDESGRAYGAAFIVLLGVCLTAGAFLTLRREIVANDEGVTVVNSFRRYPIPWTDLADIGFHRVDSEAMRGMYYTLVFTDWTGRASKPRSLAVALDLAST